MQYTWNFLLNKNLLSGKKRFFHGAILKANLSWGNGIRPCVGTLQPSYLIQEGKKRQSTGKIYSNKYGEHCGQRKSGE